jgi:catechol-2,3-dioxygenase
MQATKLLKIALAAGSIVHSLALGMSATQSSSISLGGVALRQVVLDAARHDSAHTLDVKGIMWLEHVNLVVGSKSLAARFYFEYLGMTKDSGGSFHANLGQQQFHLAENGDPAQKVTGSIGLVVHSLETLRERTAVALEEFKETQFSVVDDAEGCMTLMCPWGNRLHIYDSQDDDKQSQGPNSDSSQKMVKLHAEGGAYGAHRMSIRGNPGIRYVEVACRPGTTPAIANFYKDMLDCTVSIPTLGQAVISVGPGVHLVYIEDDKLSDDDVKAMEGVHICIYANDFKGLYNRLASKKLIWTNPRFTHLDRCDTWEEAVASRTLRFKDIIDLSTGEKILELEHETRPLRHGQYLKVPNYDPK